MASRYKDKETGTVVLSFGGQWVSWTHTAVAYAAFLSALIVGVSLHFHKIVQNEWYGYPEEWFPSVSATIGDRYPERSIFMLFIAITSGPRFALVGLWYLLTARPGRTLPKAVAIAGLVRTLTCGGWTYITSTDDHDWHDILMISYLVFTIPWTAGLQEIPCRRILWHFVAVTYTTYAFFEWSLILFDVAFDAVTALDFSTFELVIRDVNGANKGSNKSSVLAAVLKKEKESATIGVISAGFRLGNALDIAADAYHGFVFWSILTSLGVVVWYFPLWHMGISGYEAFVMSTISPALLGLKSVRSFVISNQRVFHLLSLTGLLAYLVVNPTIRLFTVGFGVSMGCLAWAATWFSDSVPRQTRIPHSRVDALCFTRWAPLQAENAVMKKSGSAVLSAFGIGGLFFALHSLLSDTSTMILWVWDGYPIRGPVSNVHAWFTIAAMTIGLMIGTFRPGLVATWTAFGVGSIGAAVLTLYQQWFGYYGALALATYLTAISVPLIANASKKSPAVVFGLGFFIYNFLVLFHVWVVAYAFVPGGPLVREHTDWIMITTMLFIGAGVFDLISEQASASKTNIRRRPGASGHRKYHVGILGLLNILFLGANYFRIPTNDYKPYHAEDRLFTAGIWTIHFSLDNDMWSSEYRMRDLIKELEIDVVGLLKSDLQRVIMGNRDTTQFLAEDLGMYVDYGPGPNKHTWGAALLSKFPILNSTHHLLPSPVGELAPAIHATLDVYGTLLDIFVFHSGQEEDEEDRHLQSEYLANLMGSSPRPSVLLSYLVTKPLEGNYNTYVSKTSGMHDVDPSDWDRWCEYILYKGLRRTGYARVSRSTITDTELQVAKFVVPRPGDDSARVWAASPKQRDKKTSESDVPPGWRFPALFNGEGVRGHFYNVFNESRYYKY
ncbi:Frag1/DRAM/Sfk1 family-domain-containing protein [Lasiosphaeria miniovina]|uniref:Frag1/DRAM/Sfk1 family-domain-containing protein n=1 Tax=Lasiosphaeria miniovina TaxID=1954250 RepID=A0AA39ZT03_9PEZI|nr:Frag1/DRAM/Sfk1 family-domain-containing protein [Lasiosphaeria miniovina]KAK0703013.1 Frag1/DRAM/Sfk1 family-domain-containing protein [Lasiosphaeria miniovina]